MYLQSKVTDLIKLVLFLLLVVTEQSRADSYYSLITEQTVSPVISQFKSELGDTKRSFISSDGREVSAVVLAPRVTGILSPEETASESDDEYLARTVKLASDQHKTLLLPKKTFYLAKRLVLSNSSDFVIDGNGSRFVFMLNQDGPLGIYGNELNRVAVKNLQIDWSLESKGNYNPMDNPFSTLGTVSPCINNGIAGGMFEADGDAKQSLSIASVSIWDDKNGWPWNRPELPSVETSFVKAPFKLSSNGSSECMPTLKAFQNERVLARYLLQNKSHTIYFYHSQDVSIQNVEIFSSPSMGIVADGGGRGYLISHVKVGNKPNQTKAGISTNADATHFANVGGDIILENNDFGWQGDDAVNITSLFININRNNASADWMNIGQDQVYRLRSFVKGEEVFIFDENLNFLSANEISDMDLDNKRFMLTQKITNQNFLMLGLDQIPRRVVMSNNYFHDHRARGILMGGIDGLVENNLIERVTLEGILLAADNDNWQEGPGPSNTIIRSNRISKVNAHLTSSDYPSAISAGIVLKKKNEVSGQLISKIVVEDNIVEDSFNSSNHPVNFGAGVKDSIDKNNVSKITVTGH